MSSDTSVATVDPVKNDVQSIIDDGPLVNHHLVRAHLRSGVAFLLVALFAGFLYSLTFIGMYPFNNIEVLSPGRVGMLHVNVLIFGFIGNMSIAALYWVVPNMSNRRVLSNLMGWAIGGLWNFIMALTIVGILGGFAQAVEWGETPNGLIALLRGDPHIFFVDELMMVGLSLVAVQFIVPVVQSYGLNKTIPVALWFIVAGLAWVPAVYLIGNYIPEFNALRGAGGAAFTGLYKQSLIGLFLASLGWGTMYYFVPSIITKPMFSQATATLGFWGLAFFYPLTGIQNYIYSTVPAFAQYFTVVATVAVEVVILTIAANFIMTLRGREGYLRTSIAVRYFYVGIIFYVIAAMHNAVQAQFWMSEAVGYTDWVTANDYLLLYGVFGFWMLGVLSDLWFRVSEKPTWFSRGVNEWAFWLNLIGVSGLFLGLTASGLMQGGMMQSLATWENIINSSQIPWRFRTLMFMVIILANSLILFNMVMTTFAAKAREVKYASSAAVSIAAGD